LHIQKELLDTARAGANQPFFIHLEYQKMRVLNLIETADFLESATIATTHDHGHAITHTGTTDAGLRFVLTNDCTGASVLSESL
jgi:Zn-dependent M32 family carboxypeptidase